MIYIFTGPTLLGQEGEKILEAIYLPPASQGDIYRIALKRPIAIGIIDGYFERVPAIWHKEILWAMEQGIHVYGSASMGALRAAELFQFGMVGVGNIFEQYQNGNLEDDDEVVLVHGPEDENYISCSEPMVNIRRSFKEALNNNIISVTTYHSLIDISKNIFYPNRIYNNILAIAEKKGLIKEELFLLKNWLKINKFNQKKEDAILMLEKIKADQDLIKIPKQVNYAMENTEWWDSLKRRAGMYIITKTQKKSLVTELLLNEFRLKGDFFHQILFDTIFRCISRREAIKLGWQFNIEDVQKQTDRFRRNFELYDENQLNDWLKNNNLTQHEFIQIIENNTQIEFVINTMYPEFMVTFTDELKNKNLYFHYLSRSIEKNTFFENADISILHSLSTEENSKKVIEWLFSKNNQELPEDLEEYSKSIGFESQITFKEAAIKEYIFVKKIINI